MPPTCKTCDLPAVVHLGPAGLKGKSGEDYCRDCAVYMVECLAAASDPVSGS